MPIGKRRRLSALRLWTVANAILIFGIWATERWGGERQLFALLVSYAPQFLFVLPSVILLIVTVLKRKRSLALANFALIAFATVFILGFRCHTQSPNAKQSILIMTFNVEKWSHGPPLVASVIRRFHPECFCLQEAGDYFYVPGHPQEELKALLPDYHILCDGEIIIGSRVPIQAHRSFLLPPGPGSRPTLMAEVTIQHHVMTIVAVHLLPCYMNGLKDLRGYGDAKLSQVTELVGVLHLVQTPIILCGDLNAQPQTGTCHLLDADYTEAFDTSGGGFGYTIPAKFPTSRIDHIYLGNGVVAQHAFVPNVIASDHRPLIADVMLQ